MTKILIAVFTMALIGCQSAKKFEAQNCHYDGAYEKGANDAKEKKGLKGEALVAECPEGKRVEVRKGYREGYDAYSKENKSFVDVIKDRVKGVAEGKPKTCMNGKDDEQVCGYGCVESKDGEVKCAQSANHACISSAGKIHCGLNCRETRPGKVTCDERETL